MSRVIENKELAEEILNATNYIDKMDKDEYERFIRAAIITTLVDISLSLAVVADSLSREE